MQNTHLSSCESCVMIHVSGRVQGVGFRFFTYQKAQKLNLVVYVRNLIDGNVEIVACGPQIQVDALINWLEMGGPDSAKIKSYLVDQIKPDKHYTAFNVRY